MQKFTFDYNFLNAGTYLSEMKIYPKNVAQRS